MAAVWEIRLYDNAGGLAYIFDQFTELVVNGKVNAPGAFALKLEGNHPAIPLFELDGFLEARWQDAVSGIVWRTELGGFVTDFEKWTDAGGKRQFVASGPGYTDLLGRTIIDTYAGSAESDKDDAGETVIKEFVDEQAGPGAGARARANLTVELDAALGTNWAGQRSNRNLLEVCQQIAEATGLQFGIFRTGADDFEFRVWEATDRTATVRFSEAFGNMAEPRVVDRASQVLNWVKVGGQGEGIARVFEYRDDAASIALSPWNQRETFLAATDQPDVAQLEMRGDEKLTENRRARQFTFRVVQTPGLMYGRDYFLGDLVTAIYDGVTYTKRVNSVQFKVNEAGSWPDVGLIDA